MMNATATKIVEVEEVEAENYQEYSDEETSAAPAQKPLPVGQLPLRSINEIITDLSKPIKARHLKQKTRGGGRITQKDITLFTRQMATMMKSGVPLLQAFDIVGKGHSNPAVARLLLEVKTDVETGSSLKQAFEKHPLYFDALYCNLIGAGEAAGILDTLLDRLATYMEKILAIKSKIKAALFYPIAFAGTWTGTTMVKVMLFNWMVKVGIEALMTPATYAVVGRLKRAEDEDHFDTHTHFTPFSLKDE